MASLGVAITFGLLMGPGCANIIPPDGGPRDTIPPLLLRSTPADSTLDFSSDRITLTFDEYVELDNFQQNAVISPLPRIYPTVTRRLNTVTVRLRDSLESNTTYTIDFGNTIKDLNEGNPAHGFTYVYSTGRSFDTLSFRGKVILAESGQLDTTLTVMLHRNPKDSAVRNERPRYISKLDSRGNFAFNNLPSGTFYLYALQDETRSYRYLNPEKLFAFSDSPVVIQPNTPPKTLYAFAAAKPRQGAQATPPAQRNPSDRRLKFQTTIVEGRHDILKPFSFTFERPLRNFDSSKVAFARDTAFTPVTGHSWTRDSTGKKLTLNYRLQENTLYHLILDKEFATDTMGFQLLRPDTISFTTLRTSNYGKISLRIRNIDLTQNPVLQFVQGGEVVNSFPLSSNSFSQALFAPGEYELRVLLDSNGNGIWDTGDFFRRRQPEIVRPIQRTITVRENWDNSFEVAL